MDTAEQPPLPVAPKPSPRVGRLAPSPTGRLHLGNLSTSLLAWAQMRALGGRLLLRIEDIDRPRVVPGAEDRILEDLRWLGIDWDEGPDIGGPSAPFRQSACDDLYNAALERLHAMGRTYACRCSRRDIEEALSAPHAASTPAHRYPGTCRALDIDPRRPDVAIRLRVDGIETIHDGFAGTLRQDLDAEVGDQVIRRRDGLWAYQLAVVVDDARMGVTDVLRGRDLLDSAPRQQALFRWLGATPPRFHHAPMVVDARGERLSKRRGDIALPGLRDAGWDAAGLRGAFAWLWGWMEAPAPLAPEELVALWQVGHLPTPTLRVPDALFDGPGAFGDGARRTHAPAPPAMPRAE